MSSNNSHYTDARYELKTLKFIKDKFVVKIYDTQSKKGTQIDLEIPYDVSKIPSRNFSYVCMN